MGGAIISEPEEGSPNRGPAPKQQADLRRMHATGDYTIADLTELFSVSRPTVYRRLQRSLSSGKTA